MTDEDFSFSEFIRRIRDGDQQAAEQLVRDFEPMIRRVVRLRLEEQHLGRWLDSVDVSQSVLASFFLRAAAGDYDLDDAAQLSSLLMQMARNKLAAKSRWQFRAKRERNRVQVAEGQLEAAADREPTPSEAMSAEELVARCLSALTVEERRLIELRRQKLSWQQIAEMMGDTPDARRMQLTRAINRVSKENGLE